MRVSFRLASDCGPGPKGKRSSRPKATGMTVSHFPGFASPQATAD